MEEAISKEVDLFTFTGDKSATHRDQFIMNGFSADMNNKKKYKKVRVSDDGLITVTFTAPETLGIREMKNADCVVKACYDNRDKLFKDGNIDNAGVNDRVKITIDAREVLKFTNEKTTVDRRKNLFESIVRVSNMSYTIEKKRLSLEADQSYLGAVKKQWFYDVSASKDYGHIEVEVSVSFIKIAILNGLTFNLKKMMEFKGRGALFYRIMQSQRYDLFKRTGRKADKGKYVYYDYVNHDIIMQGLDLLEMKNKREALKRALEAVADFEEKTGIKYEFNKAKNYWKKVSRKSAIAVTKVP